ncbi:MAG: hypothetical protein JO345_32065 [Streptosporangiaceae bacterium]|nr:hypothetical protein [Streptosporangiaceae bacterium]
MIPLVDRVVEFDQQVAALYPVVVRRPYVVTSIRPMVSGASKVLSSSFAISHQPHVAAAVEVKIHARDVPGRRFTGTFSRDGEHHRCPG